MMKGVLKAGASCLVGGGAVLQRAMLHTSEGWRGWSGDISRFDRLVVNTDPEAEEAWRIGWWLSPRLKTRI